VHSGSLGDVGQRFIGTWKRAGRGGPVHETHATFLNLEAMQATRSPRRPDLLRHVRQHGATSVRSPAAKLGRDCTNAHGDMAALEAAGLRVREGRRLAAPWDAVQARVVLTRRGIARCGAARTGTRRAVPGGVSISRLTIRLPNDKHRRLKDLAASDPISVNPLIDELATVAPAHDDARVRFETRLQRGKPARALALLDKLDRAERDL